METRPLVDKAFMDYEDPLDAETNVAVGHIGG